MNDSDACFPDPRTVLRHAPPVVFMDRIVASDARVTVTEWRVPEACPWVDSGTLAESVLVEVAAQAAAAGLGIAAVNTGEPPPPGALGSIRDFEILEEVHVGDVLRTTVEFRFEIAGAALVECHIERLGDPTTTIARGDLGLVSGTRP